MTDFTVFSKAVAKRFADMAKGPLFVVRTDPAAIWNTYLAAFPPGSNPVFRTHAEYDCSCCRHFIRDIGAVVAIQNGALTSVWDLNGLPSPYQEVADAMAAHVKQLEIAGIYLTPESQRGAEVTRALLNGTLHQWNHFSVKVPTAFVTSEADKKRGQARTTHAVLMRGLTELNPEAVGTVVDLIQSNTIYRGAEFRQAVEQFQSLQLRFLMADGRLQNLLAWSMVNSPVARFRNTVIGTLVQDLSIDVPLEDAVRIFESKVAPQNYKRPTALVTKSMVQSALKTIAELGLESALERRHARLSDVSVTSVLFVDNSVRGHLKGGIEGLLMAEVKPPPFDVKQAQDITVDDFVERVLPRATQLQVYLDNSLLRHFVSLTAPVHADSQSLFRWNNDFAWSYDGNVTDSIKDKVKRAGGQVDDVAMRISLAWYNTDDLDLHILEPFGDHIYFGNKSGTGGNGRLDVDMNVHSPVRDAVENVRWTKPPRDGIYKIMVHNFNRRESIDVGFVIEVDETSHGLVTLRYEKAATARQYTPVASIIVQHGHIVEIKVAPDMIVGSASQERWGLKTLDLVRVNALVLSPNHWDDNAVGNKHWFFILDSCHNPIPTRGIYNEFLHPRLETHRKVFEILGDKTKCPAASEQLSGVGFSSTRDDKMTVMVLTAGSSRHQAYTIHFNPPTQRTETHGHLRASRPRKSALSVVGG